jgi:hypothetical protein
MKYLLLFLLILGTNFSFAQYESIFGQNSTQWVFEWENLWPLLQDTIYVTGDTTFQGKYWKKIRCASGQIDESYLSEDTLTGKVWYKKGFINNHPFNDTTTKLSFDFSLQKGDFFDISGAVGPYGLTNASDSAKCYVDTVYYQNGRKVIEFPHSPNSGRPFKFIEGIGGTYNIIYKDIYNSMIGQYILCTYKDNIQTYSNFYYNGNCNVHTGITNFNRINTPSPVQIFPNPANNIIYFKGIKNNSPTFVEIYDSMGRLIQRKKWPNRDFLNIEFLSDGLYFLKIDSCSDIIPFQKK